MTSATVPRRRVKAPAAASAAGLEQPATDPSARKGELHQNAVQALRVMIVTGELAPGERLNERELCVRLKVSRTPIREAIKTLQNAEWPGNVRQLRNTLERAGVLYGGETVDGETMRRLVSPRKTIDREEEAEALWGAVGDLGLVSAALEPAALDDAPLGAGPADGVADPRAFLRANPEFNLKDYIAEIEVAFIKAALAESANSVSSAARILGYQRTTLIERMRKFSVQREEA